MKKYVAKQIDPAIQDSRLIYYGRDGRYHWQDDCWTTISIIEMGLTTDIVSDTIYELDRGYLADDIDTLVNHRLEYNCYFDTVEEAINDYLKPEGRGQYTEDEISRLENLVSRYGEYHYNDLDILTDILSIRTGIKYNNAFFFGYSDGYSIVFPDNEYDNENIYYFRSLLLNEGSEWQVSDDMIEFDENYIDEIDTDPFIPDGYYTYCEEPFDMDAIRKELAQQIGCEPSDILMYKYD